MYCTMDGSRPTSDKQPTAPGVNANPEYNAFQPDGNTRSYSLENFVRDYSDRFPVHIKVTEGHYGSRERETVSGQEKFIALYEKKQLVLRVKAKSGKLYSIPLGSSIPISLLYCPEGNETIGIRGVTLNMLVDLKEDSLPKVLSCCTSDQKLPISCGEVLVVKKLDTTRQKLLVQSISKQKAGISSENSKVLDLTCKTQSTFSTKPNLIALYLSDIVNHVHAPEQSPALLILDELSLSNLQTVKSTDPSLEDPVTLVDFPYQHSIVAAPAKSTGEYNRQQLLEIPITENVPVRVTVIHHNTSTDGCSKFNPRKLKIWKADTGENNQIQEILNSSLRPGHEMDGIENPQIYEVIPSPMPGRTNSVSRNPTLSPPPSPERPPDTTGNSPTISSPEQQYNHLFEELEGRAKKLNHSDLQKVLIELADCEDCWYLLALLLGIPKARLDQTLALSSNDPRRGLIESISFWLDNSPKASWLAIVQALYMLERKGKAQELAGKYEVPFDAVSSGRKNNLPKELQAVFSDEKILEIKELGRSIDMKFKQLHDLASKIGKHKEKKEILEIKLAHLKERLKFNEEYINILHCESELADLQQKTSEQQKGKSEHTVSATSLEDSTLISNKRRKEWVQAERLKLQKDFLSIEEDCRTICSQLRMWQKEKHSGEKEKRELEEKLSQKIEKANQETRGASVAAVLQEPDYLKILGENFKKEKGKYKKEVDKLRKHLHTKDTELKTLESELKAIDQSLDIQYKLSRSRISFAEPGADSLSDENRKTSLQVEEADFKLQKASTEFIRDEMSSKLALKKRQLEKSEKLCKQVQDDKRAFERGRTTSEPPAAVKRPTAKPHPRSGSISTPSKAGKMAHPVKKVSSGEGRPNSGSK